MGPVVVIHNIADIERRVVAGRHVPRFQQPEALNLAPVKQRLGRKLNLIADRLRRAGYLIGGRTGSQPVDRLHI